MVTLGIDTSNYTTSCAIYDSDSNEIIQRKKLLPVKQGEKGLRQSDAVFHHTQQLHILLQDLLNNFKKNIDAIGVSSRPRDIEGSYMPCFTVGVNTASSISSVIKKPLYTFSHQSGHIVAALYSAGKIDFLRNKFIAFHVSGGTTEALLVEPSVERILSETIIGKTNDINCGQAIDRCGVMLGLGFPCGKEIERLAMSSDKTYNPKICVKDGNCNLSGLENICINMLDNGESKENVSKFCLDFCSKTIDKMTEYALSGYGNLPVVYAGGVMSDKLIRDKLIKKYDCYFAEPDFSCDNAAGIAILTYLIGK